MHWCTKICIFLAKTRHFLYVNILFEDWMYILIQKMLLSILLVSVEASVHGVIALLGQKITGNSLIRIDAVFNRICFSSGISHTKTLLYWFLVENIIVVLTIFPIALVPAGWLSDNWGNKHVVVERIKYV